MFLANVLKGIIDKWILIFIITKLNKMHKFLFSNFQLIVILICYGNQHFKIYSFCLFQGIVFSKLFLLPLFFNKFWLSQYFIVDSKTSKASQIASKIKFLKQNMIEMQYNKFSFLPNENRQNTIKLYFELSIISFTEPSSIMHIDIICKIEEVWEYFEIFWNMEILLQFYGNQISPSSGYFHEALSKHQSIYYEILNWCMLVTNSFHEFIILSL